MFYTTHEREKIHHKKSLGKKHEIQNVLFLKIGELCKKEEERFKGVGERKRSLTGKKFSLVCMETFGIF